VAGISLSGCPQTDVFGQHSERWSAFHGSSGDVSKHPVWYRLRRPKSTLESKHLNPANATAFDTPGYTLHQLMRVQRVTKTRGRSIIVVLSHVARDRCSGSRCLWRHTVSTQSRNRFVSYPTLVSVSPKNPNLPVQTSHKAEFWPGTTSGWPVIRPQSKIAFDVSSSGGTLITRFCT
jgi:hypothetical protein